MLFCITECLFLIRRRLGLLGKFKESKLNLLPQKKELKRTQRRRCYFSGDITIWHLGILILVTVLSMGIVSGPIVPKNLNIQKPKTIQKMIPFHKVP